MTAEEERDAVVRTVTIDAAPEEVFAFFTDPAKMVLWKARAAWLEPEPGGLFRIDVNGRSIARGEYVEIDPPRRIVFTWGWEGASHPMPPGSTTVEITLHGVGDKTVLTLVHRGIPASERSRNSEGWDHYLPRLQLAAAGGDAGSDTWLQADGI